MSLVVREWSGELPVVWPSWARWRQARREEGRPITLAVILASLTGPDREALAAATRRQLAAERERRAADPRVAWAQSVHAQLVRLGVGWEPAQGEWIRVRARGRAGVGVSLRMLECWREAGVAPVAAAHALAAVAHDPSIAALWWVG